MKTKSIITLALSGLVAFNMTACKDDAAAAGAAAHQQMHPLPVSVMNLMQQDVELSSTWFGYLRGVQQADIRPEVSGTLIAQHFWDGAICEQGELLFEIDPSTYQAALDQAKANLVAAQAGVQQAQAATERTAQDVERYASLVKTRAVSEKSHTDAVMVQKEAVAGLAVAKAQVAQAQAAVEHAQINLDRTKIRAPFRGLASRGTASKGELLSASGAALTTMSSIDPIRVDFTVPANQIIGQLMDGTMNKNHDQIEKLRPFRVELSDGTIFENEGKVIAIDSQISTTGSVTFVGYIPNPEYKLRAGMPVRIHSVTSEVKGAMLVPARAVVSSMSNRSILIVAPDGTPRNIDVQLGETVAIDVPNGDGTKAKMLMQMISGTIKPLEESVREIGYDKLSDAPVIIEGGQMATRYAKANEMMQQAGAKDGFAIVVPRPFIYVAPVSTSPSVTTQQ